MFIKRQYQYKFNDWNSWKNHTWKTNGILSWDVCYISNSISIISNVFLLIFALYQLFSVPLSLLGPCKKSQFCIACIDIGPADSWRCMYIFTNVYLWYLFVLYCVFAEALLNYSCDQTRTYNMRICLSVLPHILCLQRAHPQKLDKTKMPLQTSLTFTEISYIFHKDSTNKWCWYCYWLCQSLFFFVGVRFLRAKDLRIGHINCTSKFIQTVWTLSITVMPFVWNLCKPFGLWPEAFLQTACWCLC